MITKRTSEAAAVICCLLFAACSLASAAEFQGASGAFTIDTPAGWKRMDPRLLDAMVDLYGQDRLDAAGAVTRYGFMPTGGICVQFRKVYLFASEPPPIESA